MVLFKHTIPRTCFFNYRMPYILDILYVWVNKHKVINGQKTFLSSIETDKPNQENQTEDIKPHRKFWEKSV